MRADKLWRFDSTSYAGVVDVDNYTERNDVAMTTVYVGSHFEKNLTTGETTSYYTFNGQRVALRENNNVTWIHGDNLGSAALTTNAGGAKVSELRYTPFGSVRYAWNQTATDKRFTGHISEDGIGLIDMRARFFNPLIGRFLSPDSIVQDPSDPQSLNRYAYARNNPTRYVDPTGHCFVFVLDTLACAGLVMLIVAGASAATAAILNTPAGKQVAANAERALVSLTSNMSVEIASSGTSSNSGQNQPKDRDKGKPISSDEQASYDRVANALGLSKVHVPVGEDDSGGDLIGEDAQGKQVVVELLGGQSSEKQEKMKPEQVADALERKLTRTDPDILVVVDRTNMPEATQKAIDQRIEKLTKTLPQKNLDRLRNVGGTSK